MLSNNTSNLSNNKYLKKVTLGLISVFMIIIYSSHLLIGVSEISISERRKLATKPVFTIEDLFSGKYFSDMEKYLTDQFPLRDFFRGTKSISELYLFNKKDIHDIYIYNGHLIKRTDLLNMSSLEYFTQYINSIHDDLLSKGNPNIYYSIIPDKNFFVEDDSYPKMNYLEMEDFIYTSLVTDDSRFQYIPLFDALTLNDYYLSDTHWKQEHLMNVYLQLQNVMDIETDLDLDTYSSVTHDFKGVYAGLSGLPVNYESITYLSKDFFDELTIIDYEFPDNENIQVYNPDDIQGNDPYEGFLGGAAPLMDIYNPNSTTGKELVIFRDSFGSSLIPLLIEEYARITLVDTRYVPYQAVSQFVEINPDDVLFLYNTEVINNSQMLR